RLIARRAVAIGCFVQLVKGAFDLHQRRVVTQVVRAEGYAQLPGLADVAHVQVALESDALGRVALAGQCGVGRFGEVVENAREFLSPRSTQGLQVGRT